MASQGKKNISWQSQIYIVSLKKIISIILVLICHFFLVFVIKDLYIAPYVEGALYILLLSFLCLKSNPVNENMLQIALYEKKQARYEMQINGLAIKYSDKEKFILYKKVEYFSNISPFRINKNFLVPEAFVFGDYAESLKYKIYYLFISKTFFYTEVLPIFIPFEQDDKISEGLSSVITFASYKATKDTKFCIWGLVFPLVILFLVFLVLISL